MEASAKAHGHSYHLLGFVQYFVELLLFYKYVHRFYLYILPLMLSNFMNQAYYFCTLTIWEERRKGLSRKTMEENPIETEIVSPFHYDQNVIYSLILK